MTKKLNPFHLVEVSPWPILASGGALSLFVSALNWFNDKTPSFILLTLPITFVVAFVWWRDIHRESLRQGNHSPIVINGLKTGIILFIVSEVLFFVSFFWGFLHRRISPIPEIGQAWPPSAIHSFNPMRIPLINTILLLSSGVSVTWAHHEILKRNFKKSMSALMVTVSLGALFSALQAFEYIEAPFSISDSAYGTTFFIATGFHGLHVLIGSVFLTVSAIRLNRISSSSNHIVGFECSAWYWHFVDVVWILLYSLLYWWGS